MSRKRTSTGTESHMAYKEYRDLQNTANYFKTPIHIQAAENAILRYENDRLRENNN